MLDIVTHSSSHGQTMRTVQQLITLFASLLLLLLLLLLLIGIYDGVGSYDENVNQLLECVVMSVSIRSHYVLSNGNHTNVD